MTNKKYNAESTLAKAYMVRFFEEAVNSQQRENGALRKTATVILKLLNIQEDTK